MLRNLKRKVKDFTIDYRYTQAIKRRRRFSHNCLLECIKNVGVANLDSKELETIRTKWDGLKYDIRWFNMYKKLHGTASLSSFLPYEIYYAEVLPFYNRILDCDIIDDKNLYSKLFNDVRCPKEFLHKVKGIFLDQDYRIINKEQAREICNTYGSDNELVFKDATDSEGGHGVRFWCAKCDTIKKLEEILDSSVDFVCQERITQCSELNAFNKNSVNTIRVLSFINNDKVEILSSILRLGVNGSKVDNSSMGGVFCGINSDGSLKTLGFDLYGKSYQTHPQGERFDSHHIPNFDKCIEMIKTIAPRLSGFAKVCSWDIAVESDNLPTLIEMNASYGGLSFHQFANGAIFEPVIDVIINDLRNNKT